MPVPTLFSQLSTTPALNSPPGGEDVHPTLDDYLRQIFAFIAMVNQSVASAFPVEFQLACSDLDTALAVKTHAGSFHVQSNFTASVLSASVDTVSSSGVVTIDVKVGGVSRLSTLLTIDAGESTSFTAAVPAVFSDPVFTVGQVVVISITTAGTGAKGLKVGVMGAPA